MVTSMVVLVVYAIHVLPGTRERYAPVAAHLHGPRAFSGAAEFVNLPRLGLLPSQSRLVVPNLMLTVRKKTVENIAQFRLTGFPRPVFLRPVFLRWCSLGSLTGSRHFRAAGVTRQLT